MLPSTAEIHPHLAGCQVLMSRPGEHAHTGAATFHFSSFYATAASRAPTCIVSDTC